jgi:hypothetical protein
MAVPSLLSMAKPPISVAATRLKANLDAEAGRCHGSVGLANHGP